MAMEDFEQTEREARKVDQLLLLLYCLLIAAESINLPYKYKKLKGIKGKVLPAAVLEAVYLDAVVEKKRVQDFH